MDSPHSAAAATELPLDVVGASIDPQAREVIRNCLAVARERLDMDIGWLAEFRGDRKIFRVVDGASDDWEIYEDSYVPLAQSYCQRMYAGQIPNAIPDTQALPEVATLDITRSKRIGSYIGVPLVLPDGELRGAFCCARHSEQPQFDERDVRFMQVLARLVGDELAFRHSQRQARRMERELSSVKALVAALQARDNYTGEHSTRVVSLARAVGLRLDLPHTKRHDLEQVALLHDIGKVGIPDAILHKPGALDEEEWAVMQQHPTIGARLVASIPDLARLAPGIEAEHERWDGTGYPKGLAGEEIPVESRITFVCDSFHAMISDRPYRKALSEAEAVAELRRCRGSMFWPAAVDALLAELDA